MERKSKMNSSGKSLKILIPVFLIMLGFGSYAIARNPARQAARQACIGDRETFCPGLERGGGRIIACLRHHFDKLSSGCRQALTQAGVARQNHPPSK